jgi:putative membrane protein
MMKVILVGTAVLAMGAAPAFAQRAPKANADHQFVVGAARGGMAQVELGKLAAQKGSRPEVKQFGQRMVDDHGKAVDELRTLAQNKNITLPTSIAAKDRALQNRLSKLSGPAFDRAYMSAMVTDHTKDVSAFRRTSQSARDGDVKAWASKTLPTVQQHLQLARDGNRAVGTSGRR